MSEPKQKELNRNQIDMLRRLAERSEFDNPVYPYQVSGHVSTAFALERRGLAEVKLPQYQGAYLSANWTVKITKAGREYLKNGAP